MSLKFDKERVKNHLKSRTQKARGVEGLKAIGAPVPGLIAVFDAKTPKAEVEQTCYKYSALWGNTLGFFTRPCPIRPRHGFVDSKVAKGADEVWAIMQKTFEVEPDGEVMLMFPAKAYQSAIVTPSLLTFGDGNDGATAGKNTVSFPLTGLHPVLQKLAPMVGVGKNEDPYIELVVSSENGTQLTQLRAGPKMSSLDPDFIPAETVVKQIIKAGGDLLEWENKILSAEPGTVVYHPGGSLADHYYVHARSANVPVLTTREPVMGETLVPTDNIRVLDTSGVLDGLLASFHTPNLRHSRANSYDGGGYDGNNFYQAANLVLQVLHNSAAIASQDSWWLGYGIGTAIRLGHIGLWGEARHYQGRGGHRSGVYQKRMNDTFPTIVRDLPDVYTCFRYGGWGGGFGGVPWAQCALALHKLVDATVQFVRTPTLEKSGEMLRALNTMINQQHNGGWWFNKFTPQEAMDQIQRHEPVWMGNTLAAMKVAHTSYQMIQELDGKTRALMLQEIAGLTPSLDLDVKLMSVEYAPFSGVLFTKVDGGRLQNAGRPVPLPITKIKNQTVGSVLLGTAGVTAKISDGKLAVITPDVVLSDDELTLR